MKKINKILSAVLACAMLTSFTGCGGNKPTPEEQAQQAAMDTLTRELRQNDYRGGVQRTYALQESVLNVMDYMKSNNTTIRETSPNSFWTTEGYQDFVSNFLDIKIISDTQWFNEEETDWETIMAQIVSTENSFSIPAEGKLKSGITIGRNEKDDYSITGVKQGGGYIIDNKTYSYEKPAEYRILYDCDKDWCKAYSKVVIDEDLDAVTTQLFEYQRIDNNTFAIQTSRERLVIVLTPVESDVDIREREVAEFYYSKLVNEGLRTTYEPYEPLPEVDEVTLEELKENAKKNEFMKEYPYTNGEGDLALHYGEKDSMFYRDLKKNASNWVFEDKALQQGIVYKGGILVVTTYNKLSDDYERFVYARSDADTSIVNTLENMVEINNLVGVQSVEEVVTNKKEEAEANKENATTSTNDTSSENVDSTDTSTEGTETSSEADTEETSSAETSVSESETATNVPTEDKTPTNAEGV